MANFADEIQPKMSGSQIFFCVHKVLFVGGGGELIFSMWKMPRKKHETGRRQEEHLLPARWCANQIFAERRELLGALSLQREESEALMGRTDTKRITSRGAGVGK